MFSSQIFYPVSFSLTFAPSLTPLSLSSSLFPPTLSLSFLPLFRLCKVQLGFGAFDLQAWRQEDALSEYALLGSLCVTLYFFALLFYLSSLLTFVLIFSSYIRQVTVSSCLPNGSSSLVEKDPLPLISPVSCRNLVSPKSQPFRDLYGIPSSRVDSLSMHGHNTCLLSLMRPLQYNLLLLDTWQRH